MPTKHDTEYIEAYLDHRLSGEKRQWVEEHLESCPACTRDFLEAQRLSTQLRPTLQSALGRPSPPPGLRFRVQEAVVSTTRSRYFTFPWLISGRLLNASGTLAVIALLAFGAFLVVRTQLPGVNPSTSISSLRPGNNDQGVLAVTETETPITPLESATATTPKPSASLGDSLPELPPTGESNIVNERAGAVTNKPRSTPSAQDLSGWSDSARPEDSSALPTGTIAFSFFNPAPDRQVYEIHLIKPNGTDHRLFPLDGVSEPALSWTKSGLKMAYRAWSEPTSPRSLLTSDLDGEFRNRIGGYWEDAQPDWSPTENRLIFASQRESDRRWRLYTSWGNGLAEKELRREGKSPSFAPDGYNFVFEGCDETGNRCGLWIGNLGDSEYNSRSLLKDPQAQAPDWSPEGEQIAFMANVNNNWDLYLINSEGSGDVHRLTTDPAIDGLPIWSPDGEWLAFLSNRGGNWGIWILQVKSNKTRRVFDFEDGIFIPPAHEPYGERNWQDEQISWSR